MDDFKQLIKNTGLKMAPFTAAVGVYFYFEAYKNHGKTWATFLKCAPIVCLMLFILLHGIASSKRSHMHKILFGLIFSCIGDALLNHNMFPHGMGAFGIAQIFYVLAFGFRPLKLWIGIILYAGGVAAISVLHKNLDSIILIGLPIYTVLLITMCWRSIARAIGAQQRNYALEVICAIASILFVVSDSLIAFDQFHAPIKNSTFWIMTTYYAAQFGIALSVAELQSNKTQFNSSQPQSGSSKKIK